MIIICTGVALRGGMNIIPLRLSMVPLHSKHGISKLPLRAGLKRDVQLRRWLLHLHSRFESHSLNGSSEIFALNTVKQSKYATEKHPFSTHDCHVIVFST